MKLRSDRPGRIRLHELLHNNPDVVLRSRGIAAGGNCKCQRFARVGANGKFYISSLRSVGSYVCSTALIFPRTIIEIEQWSPSSEGASVTNHQHHHHRDTERTPLRRCVDYRWRNLGSLADPLERRYDFWRS